MSSSPALASILTGFNAEYIANLYREFLKNPSGVDSSWRAFFDTLRDDERAVLGELTGASWAAKEFKKPNAPFGVTTADEVLKTAKPAANAKTETAPTASPSALKDSIQAVMMVKAYRMYGHFLAKLDPLGLKQPVGHPDLDPAKYGLSNMNKTVYLAGILGFENVTVGALLEKLSSIYCNHVGVEVQQVISTDERAWLESFIETKLQTKFNKDEKKTFYKQLVAGQGLEDFLHTKYVGTKRFGLDGGESYIPCLEEITRRGVELGVREVNVGMAHRGRLNTLTNVMGKPFTKLFAEFNGVPSTPEGTPGSGDVKYHMGYSNDRQIAGALVHMSLTPNPSHLEVVNPVVTGKVRGKQDIYGDVKRKEVLTMLVHGDAAFAGQGLVMETLMLSELKGYNVGGTVHIIINNQNRTFIGQHDFLEISF